MGISRNRTDASVVGDSGPPESESRSGARRAAILLALIFAAALALRLSGRDYLLPYAPNSDERVFAYQLQELRGQSLTPVQESSARAYPTLIARVSDIVLPRAQPVDDMGVDARLADAARDLLGIRTLLAVLSSLGALATYAFARRFLGRPAALVESALFAGSLLHAWYSPQARPHAVAGVLMLCTVVAAIDVRRSRTAWNCVLLGVSAGAAIGCLQSSASVLPAVAVAYLVRDRTKTRVRDAWVLLTLAIVGASAWMFVHVGAAAPSESSDPQDVLVSGIHGVRLADFGGGGFAALAAALWSYDPLILVLGLAGLAWALVRTRCLTGLEVGRRRDVYVVLAHALPFLVAFGLFDRTFQRFAIPLLPYLATLAGYVLVEGGAWLARATRLGWLRFAVAIVAIAVQFGAGAHLAALRVAPSTQSQAAAWIREHVAPADGRLVIVPTVELPLLRRPASVYTRLAEHRTWFALWVQYQVAHPVRDDAPDAYDLVEVPFHRRADRELFGSDPAAFVGSLGARYAIVEVITDTRRPILARLRDAVRAQGTLVARFGPRVDVVATDPPILAEHDGEGSIDSRFAWRAIRYQSQGPEIEIYRLDP